MFFREKDLKLDKEMGECQSKHNRNMFVTKNLDQEWKAINCQLVVKVAKILKKVSLDFTSPENVDAVLEQPIVGNGDHE